MKFELPFLGNKKSKQGEILLALDIGTEYVKAILFDVDELEKKVNIRGFGRCRQHSNAMQGAMIINMENVVNACDRAVGLALDNADKVLEEQFANKAKAKAKDIPRTAIPKRMIIGIAGELVKGVTIMADYEREKVDEKITEKEMNEVVEQIKSQAFNDALIDISEEVGIAAESLREINSKVNSIYIDGVKVDEALGLSGKNVNYRIFSTFAPAMHINSLKEIARALDLEIISIEVEPYAIARAVKGGRSQNYSSIIIDIGGGTTDIAVIDRGAVAGTKMFAYGGKVFTKRLAVDLNLELNEAERQKIDYTKGQLGHKLESEIKSALNKDLPIWADGVELALAEIEDVEQFPGIIYLCGGGSALPEMKEAVLQHPWLQVLPFAKFPRVEFLFPNQLEDIVDETRTLIDPADIAPIALARMALEKGN